MFYASKGRSFGSLVNSGGCPKKSTAQTGDFSLSKKGREKHEWLR